jgi:hypothetical protein
MATMRNASIPSRRVTTSIWSISTLPRSVKADRDLRGENQLAVLCEAQTVLAAIVLDDRLTVFAEGLMTPDLLTRERGFGLKLMI